MPISTEYSHTSTPTSSKVVDDNGESMNVLKKMNRRTQIKNGKWREIKNFDLYNNIINVGVGTIVGVDRNNMFEPDENIMRYTNSTKIDCQCSAPSVYIIILN